HRRAPDSGFALGRDRGLATVPRALVCVDISTNQGRDTVGSLVWFEAGRPKKAEYRRFRITGAPQDDFAAVREVVTRYLTRRRGEDKALPDLIVIDGGKGQLAAALEAPGAARGLRLGGRRQDRDTGRDRGPARVFHEARRAGPRPLEGAGVTLPWTLQCANCGATRDAAGLPGVCERCGQPYLVRYDSAPGADAKARLRERGWTMWRYREWLPLADGEAAVSLGEGGTPLVALRRLGAKYGLRELALKDEGTNPTGSFKARGLSAAVTRAVRGGAQRLVVPTAGNAGIALAAYAARAGASARVYAPESTPPTILAQIRAFG